MCATVCGCGCGCGFVCVCARVRVLAFPLHTLIYFEHDSEFDSLKGTGTRDSEKNSVTVNKTYFFVRVTRYARACSCRPFWFGMTLRVCKGMGAECERGSRSQLTRTGIFTGLSLSRAFKFYSLLGP